MNKQANREQRINSIGSEDFSWVPLVWNQRPLAFKTRTLPLSFSLCTVDKILIGAPTIYGIVL